MKDSRAENVIDQPNSHIKGSAITGTTWGVTFNGTGVNAKGVLLRSGGSDGTLRVHLTEDPVGTWYDIDLVAGDPAQGYQFDKVHVTGSTVLKDANLIIFPSTRVLPK